MKPLPRRPLLFAGITVLALWVAFKAAPTVLARIREARWQFTDRVRLLEQSRRELALEAAIADSSKAIKEAMVSLAPRLLSGTTPAEAADALNGLISLAADRSSTKLTAVSAEEDSASAGLLRRVAVRAQFDGDIRGLAGFLRSLVEGETVLVADRLQVVAAEPGGSGAGPEVLRIELTVRGWYQAAP